LRDFLKIDDFRNLNIQFKLLEDQFKSFGAAVDAQSASNNNLIIKLNSILTRHSDLEAFTKRIEVKLNKLEDQIQLNEGRVKENQKALEELPILRKNIKSNTRDILGIEEEVEKIKKQTRSLEDKLDKSNTKKLTKNEKTTLNSIEAEVAIIQEKILSLETLTEHLNEVKYEDFVRRFRKKS